MANIMADDGATDFRNTTCCHEAEGTAGTLKFCNDNEHSDNINTYKQRERRGSKRRTMAIWAGKPTIKGSTETMRMALLTFSLIGIQ
jgi:hypothetical protein